MSVKSNRTSSRVPSVLGFDYAKAVFFKRVGCDHAQKRIVFDYEDHWLRLAHTIRTN
jgi:hypothetical protein